MGILLLLLALAAAVVFWFDNQRARERAVMVGRRACEGIRVQLLDQTVSLRGLRLQRPEGKSLAWRRIYRFDFSPDGRGRRQGEIIVQGRQVESVSIETETGREYLFPPDSG
jgi:hypothetical protein